MTLMMFSCEYLPFTEPDGRQDDTIKTSVDTVTLSDENPTAEITTAGKHWLMIAFEENGVTYPFEAYLAIPEDPEQEILPSVALPEGYTLKVGEVAGLMDGWRTVTEISCDWVTITRTLQKVTITAVETETDAPKTMKVWLWDRNYSESITIKRL